MGRMTYFMMSGVCEERAEHEVRIQTRQGNAGTDLPTLMALLDSGNFSAVTDTRFSGCR